MNRATLEEVLPNAVRKRMVVEAAESFGWHRFIGLDGDSVTMNRFGASALVEPASKFGFTVENVVASRSTRLIPIRIRTKALQEGLFLYDEGWRHLQTCKTRVSCS